MTGSKSVDEINVTYALPSSVSAHRDSVLTVLTDNMGARARFDVADHPGLEETGDDWDIDFSRRPRGIRGYALDRGDVTDWRVVGRLGGSDQCVSSTSSN